MRRFSGVRAALGLLVLVALVAPWPGPAARAATPLPTVLSPAPATTLSGEFQGPIRIDFADVAPARWNVRVSLVGGCPDPLMEPYCDASVTVDAEEAHGTIDVYLPVPVQRVGTYDLMIQASGAAEALHQTFQLAEGIPADDPEPPASVDIVRLSPADGVHFGDTASIVVDFADRSAAYPYEVWVFNPNAGDFVHKTVYATGTRTVSLGTMTSYGLHSVVVRDGIDQSVYDSTSYYLKSPRPIVGIAHVQPRVFFPILRDGFRDSVRFRYGVEASDSVPWDVDWQVRDPAGTVLASGTAPSNVTPGVLTWDGLTDEGIPVQAGTYYMLIRATTLDGGVGVDREVFYAETAVSRRETISLRGSTGERHLRGDCLARTPHGALAVECDKGTARATYVFHTPANARFVTFRVRGSRSCCVGGEITTHGRQVSPRRYVVSARAVGPLSYTIHEVVLRYTHSVRH